MSMQLNTMPASAGAGIAAESSLGSRISDLFQRLVAAVRARLELRRQLAEIQALSDRELGDIGLAHCEIEQLRRGEVFTPMGWSKQDVARDVLPF